MTEGVSAKIDRERFLADLHALRGFGRDGTGVRRQAFSEPDIAARRWLAERFADAGLTPRFDPFSNLFGLPPGDAPCLLVGSHTDSQPEGGWLDGALGVIAGLEAARALRDAGGPAIAVVSFQDEESRFDGLLGGRVFTGEVLLDAADALTDDDGVALGPLRRAVPELADAVMVDPARFTGFVEAHIEQGLELESRAMQAAVVDRIVGVRQRTVRLLGEQNHAGTTRMARRRDAMRGAARLYLALDAAFAPLADAATVWTIGRLVLSPNANSIVPGAAELQVQWRDVDAGRLDAMDAALRETADRIATESGLDLEIGAAQKIAPTAMDPGFVAVAEAAAETVAPGRWMRLGSGAIHDAATLSALMPSVMVFAPSIGGISHSFLEDTAEDDLVVCAQVVAETAARLAGA